MGSDKIQETDFVIEVTDQLRTGVYANYFSVSVNPELIVIDSGNVLPEPGTGKRGKLVLVSRVVTTMKGAKSLVGILDELIKKSETKGQPKAGE